MSFHVGQKVVCVDDQPNQFSGFTGLKNGAVYTISGFDTRPSDQNIPGIYLNEIAASPDQYFPNSHYIVHGSFRASRFRPVHEKKTSIEIFQRMLLPNTVDA